MRLLLLSLLSALVLPAALAQTGRPVPELAGYDAFFPDFLDRHGLPGAAVAVAKDGRLVYARGFGEADADAGVLVEPTSRFRIASISKPITGVVAMALAEDGRLDLEAPAFALLDGLPAPDGQTEDARLADVTVRDLLLHTGGWDRDGTGYDPMFDNARIAAEMGVTGPASVETIIRYMRGRPLDFTPGARYAYSNFGYAVLGRVLERVAGEPYEQLVQGVLADAGIAGMEIGASRLSGRLPGEVRYYPTGQTAPSVFDGSRVPWPYGGFYLESMDAHGGWVASAPDLLRLTTALDGLPNRPDLLSAASMAEMTGRPGVSTWTGTPYWYGLGWSVNTSGHWWHLGSLPGSESLVVWSSYQGACTEPSCSTHGRPSPGPTWPSSTTRCGPWRRASGCGPPTTCSSRRSRATERRPCQRPPSPWRPTRSGASRRFASRSTPPRACAWRRSTRWGGASGRSSTRCARRATTRSAWTWAGCRPASTGSGPPRRAAEPSGA